MKTIHLSRIFILACAALTINACTTDTTEPVEPPIAEPTVSADDLAAIESMGFSTDGIVATEEYYLVEGDIVIPKETLAEADSKTRQNYYGNSHTVSNSWLANHNNTIKISVRNLDSSMPYYAAMTRYNNVLSTAITDFNRINNFKIKLEKVSWPLAADIEVIAENIMPDGYMCAANIPMNGAPGVLIRINAYTAGKWGSSVMPDYKVRGSLVHAIGHCLGLAHKEPNSGSSFNEDTYSQQYLDGTDPDDGASIMDAANHHFMGPSVVTGYLSAGDKDALVKLYPKFVAPELNLSITGPSYAGVNKQMKYTVNLGNTALPASDFSFEWTASGATFVGSSTSQSATVKYSSMGSKSISVRVTYNPLPLEPYNAVSKTFTIGEDPIKDIVVTGPSGGVVGNTYSYTVSYTDNRPNNFPVTYDWYATFDDDFVVEGRHEKSVQVRYNKIGAWDFAVNIFYDAVNYQGFKTFYAYYPPTISAATKVTNDTYKIQLTNTYSFVSYEWNVPDIWEVVSIVDNVLTFKPVGSRTAEISVRTLYSGNYSPWVEKVITLDPIENLTIECPSKIYRNTPVTFTASFVDYTDDSSAITYEWSAQSAGDRVSIQNKNAKTTQITFLSIGAVQMFLTVTYNGVSYRVSKTVYAYTN